MSVRFVFGGSGCGKTYFMQEMVLELAQQYPQKQYIYLVPEQFTMQTQKELIQKSRQKGILNIEVQSFVRLAFRVFSETGAKSVPVLDDMGKTMVLKKVLSGIEDKLSYFGTNAHKKGYVQEIKSFLSEIYQYGISEETLDEMIETAENRPVLVRKLQDMKIIYQAFAEYMENNYITSEEVMTVFASVVENSAILRDCVFFLDGFTGFTPTQYEVIAQLIRVARKLYVSVTMDERESIVKTGHRHSLFYMSQKMIVTIRRLAKQYGAEVLTEIWTGKKPEETRFYRSKELAHLEKTLFRYPVKPYPDEVSDISIHVLHQPENELEFVAQQIQSLLEDRQCRYRDIAVVACDLSVYGMLAGQVFKKAQIPCFIDQKRSVEDNPFVEFINAALEIFLSNFQKDKMLAYAKNFLFWGEREQCDILDNFLCASGIRGYKKWHQVWDAKKAFFGLSEKEASYVNLQLDEIRVDILGQLETLYEAIGKGTHTVQEYAKALCQWFIEQGFAQKLDETADAFAGKNDYAAEREYRQIYGIVIEVFERLVELLGGESMKLQEFKELLDTGFSEARIGLIPPGVDQVVVGDLNRTRLANIKHLFFVGVNDVNLPKTGSHGGVISDSERLFLAEEEFSIAPTIRESIYTEQFYLYLNFTKTSQHLYLSYCKTGNDGKAQMPAYIIERILQIYPKLTTAVEESRTDDAYYLGTDMGLSFLIQGLRNRDYTRKKWQEIFRFYKADKEQEVLTDALVKAAYYREEKTALSKEVVKALYQDVLRGSTSQFERYAACAFSYFMRYGLRLKEKQEHEVAFFDIGNIVHEALEAYTQKLIAKKKKWEEVSDTQQKQWVEECIDTTVKRYKNDLLHSTKRDTYLITRLKRMLERTVWAITKQMERGEFTTTDSEFSFEVLHPATGSEVMDGMEQREQEEQFCLLGRIDRIDKMQLEEADYIKIVDYKTGKKTLSLSDLYYGLQMQLMVYLKAGVTEAQEKTKKLIIPAGILYYNIDDPMIEGKASKEKIEAEILKGLKMDGLINEDAPIIPAMDSTFMEKDNLLTAGVISDILPIATNKDGTLSKKSKTVTSQDFSALFAYTEEKLSEIHQNIIRGEIAANPYQKVDSSGENACDYCPYHSICRFDRKLAGNEYRFIEKLSDDDVIMRITKNDKKEERHGGSEMDRGTKKGN